MKWTFFEPYCLSPSLHLGLASSFVRVFIPCAWMRTGSVCQVVGQYGARPQVRTSSVLCLMLICLRGRLGAALRLGCSLTVVSAWVVERRVGYRFVSRVFFEAFLWSSPYWVIGGIVCPVLKHGPRSLSCRRGEGVKSLEPKQT